MALGLIVWIAAIVPQRAFEGKVVRRVSLDQYSRNRQNVVVRKVAVGVNGHLKVQAAKRKNGEGQLIADMHTEARPTAAKRAPLADGLHAKATLGPINKIFMLWLPKHPVSKERILGTVCRNWPAELKSKLSLVDGLDARDFNGSIAGLMNTPLAQEVFGESVKEQQWKAQNVFVAGPSKSAATAVNLGHYSVWKKVAEGPEVGLTIVLEDDADFIPNARNLASLEGIIIPVNTSSNPSLVEPTLVMLDPRKAGVNGVCRACYMGCGMTAYAIDKGAAEYLLRKANLALVTDMYLEQTIKMVCPVGSSPFTHAPGPSITKSMHSLQHAFRNSTFEVDLKVCHASSQAAA